MKKIALIATLLLCVLLLAGCGEKTQQPSGNAEKPASSTEKPADNTESPAKDPQTEITALDLLRDQIADKNGLLGVAFFGYIDSAGNETAVRELVAGSTLAESYPFLKDCAPVLLEGAELYAFVPVNGDTAVTVCAAEISEDGNYIDRKEAPLYTGKPGEVVILRCNLSEVFSNVLISATDGRNALAFHPMISMANGRMVPEDGCYDFSAYKTDPVEAAREYLLTADEVRRATERGMELLYTGDTETVEGRSCLLFALGTNHEEQFVREQLYAVSDDLIYNYSVITDSWEILRAG